MTERFTLVLVANSAEAHLFRCGNLRTDNLNLIKEFSHPDSRKKVSDLISDKPGHYKTDAGAHSAYAKADPKKVEAEHFALELVKNIAENHDTISKLVLIAPTHFSSLMKKHLHSHISHIADICECINKDYTKYTEKDLLAAIREHLFE